MIESSSAHRAPELLSDGYRNLNRELHQSRADWGTTGCHWAPTVLRLSDIFGTRDLLDYGCGKATLASALPFPIRGYDPAIPALAAPPAPADLVVCTDVMEHVEPDCLEAVLDDLVRVTRRAALISIATREAIHRLPDGRNAHLIQHPIGWWRKRLQNRFQISYEQNLDDRQAVFVVQTLPR